MMKINNLTKIILIMLFVFLLNTNYIGAQNAAEQKDCQDCPGSAFQNITPDYEKSPGWNCKCRNIWGQTLICDYRAKGAFGSGL